MRIVKLVIYSIVLIIMLLQSFAIAQSAEKRTDNIRHSSAATKRANHKKLESYSGRLSQDMLQMIIATANYYHLDPNLLAIIIRQESGFNTQATSNKGAMGLMQMIPSTARRFGVTNAYDPNQSLHGGSRYLVWLLRKFRGRLDLALAGYNAGEGAVEKFGYRVPPYQETQHYVRSITLNYLATLGKRPISTITATGFNKSIKSNSNSKGNNSAKNLSKRELSKLATLDEVWSRSN